MCPLILIKYIFDKKKFTVPKSFIIDVEKWQKTLAKPSTKISASAQKVNFIFGQIKFQRHPF